MTANTTPPLTAAGAPTRRAALEASTASWTPVDRRLVHKTAASEVLATGVVSVSCDLVAVASRWPDGHHLFDRRPGTPGHVLLLVETIRQAGLCLAHHHLAVPVGEQFVFHRIRARLAVPVAGPALPPEPTTTLLQPTLRHRAGRPSAAELAVEIWRGPTLWATASAGFSWLGRPVFDRLRAAGRAAATATGLIPCPRDGTLAEQDDTVVRRFPVGVDRGDPTFFDHEVDHLPGMLLIDAALRAAAADGRGAGARPAGVDLAFDRFAELDVPTWALTEPAPADDGPATTVVLAQQHGVVASGRVLLDS